MRGDSRRQEQHTVQCQRITRGKCRFDVPDVDGIERAAENSDACAEAHSARFIFGVVTGDHHRGVRAKPPRRFWSRIEVVVTAPVHGEYASATGLQQIVGGLRGEWQ